MSLIALGASVSALSLATPVWAESEASTSAGADAAHDADRWASAHEIVVSARRRNEAVQDVPQTINVVTAADVEKLNLRTFEDIATIVPGLTMTQTSSFSSQATVRGIAFVPEASGNNPSVAFYLNDAPISSGFLFQSTFDFGQFELQRGPQGTLRGRSSPSGSIAVTMRRPDLDEVGMTMNGTITDLHARKIDGAFNIPIIRDMLAVRLAGVIDNNRGNRVRSIKQASDPAHNDGPYRRTQAIRGSVRFEPTDWIAANVMYQALHAEDHSYSQVVSDEWVTGAPRTTPLIRPFDRLSLDDQGGYGRQDHDILIGNLDVRFGGQQLSYVGSYNKQDFAALGAQDNGDFYAPPRLPAQPRTMSDLAGFEPVCQRESQRAGLRPTTGSYYQCTHGVAKRESHELRLTSEERIAGIFDYVVGAFYDHNKNPVNLTQETPLVALVDGVPTGTVNVSRSAILRNSGSTEKSAFGNITAHLLADRLELSGGLRYIDFKSNSTLRTTSTPNSTPPALAELRDHANATVYLASAKYRISPNIMVYALTGSSWRPGPRLVGNFSVGPTGTEGPSAREKQFMNLPAERSKSYEIGAKTSFLNGRGRFNISAYYQDFKNYPYRGPAASYVNYSRVPTGGVPIVRPSVGSFNFVSPVPVTVKGVEAEAAYQIRDRWSIAANASYARGRIKNGTVACTDLNRDGSPDQNVATPTLPDLQGSLPAGENLAVCPGFNGPATTTPRFSANIQSEYGFDIGNTMSGFLRGSATISGKTKGDPNNSFDNVGAYGLLNLFAGLRGENGTWEITGFVKNILNERQVLSVGSGVLSTSYRNGVGQAQPPFRSEYRSVAVTAPREFGISARIALGSR